MLSVSTCSRIKEPCLLFCTKVSKLGKQS